MPATAVVQSPTPYGGIRRRILFFAIWPLALIWEVGTRSQSVGAFLIAIAIALALVYYRTKNIGLGSWAWAIALIPVLNLFFLAYCVVAPEGYADSKKLDGAAWTLMILLLLVFFIPLMIAIALDVVSLLAN